MRKSFSALFPTAGLVLIAAGTAGFAQFPSGSYGSTNTNNLKQTVPSQLSQDGNFSVAPFPSLAPELAEGEGEAETQSFCAACHSTRYITMQPPLPAATWDAEVSKMIKTFGAAIPDASAKRIISYLQQHYTPENRKQ
jgi:mono/diheme cytochrome c family protein